MAALCFAFTKIKSSHKSTSLWQQRPRDRHGVTIQQDSTDWGSVKHPHIARRAKQGGDGNYGKEGPGVTGWPWPLRPVAVEVGTIGVPVNRDEMFTGMKALHKCTRTVPTANGSIFLLPASPHAWPSTVPTGHRQTVLWLVISPSASYFLWLSSMINILLPAEEKYLRAFFFFLARWKKLHRETVGRKMRSTNFTATQWSWWDSRSWIYLGREWGNTE